MAYCMEGTLAYVLMAALHMRIGTRAYVCTGGSNWHGISHAMRRGGWICNLPGRRGIDQRASRPQRRQATGGRFKLSCSPVPSRTHADVMRSGGYLFLIR